MDLFLYLSNGLPDLQFQDKIKKKQFLKGEYLYQPPEMPNEVFEIISGVVKIGSYTVKGEDACYDFLFNREIIGNLRYLDGQFFEFAKAATDLEVITYDLNLYKHYIVHDPVVSEWFNRTVVSRWCRMETRLFKICTLSPKERVINLFQEFDMAITCPNYKQIWIPDLLTDKDIAQLTGLTRQTVSKILRSWPSNKQEPFYNRKKKIV